MLDSHDQGGLGEYVPFVASGVRATGQYRCSDCGYGITIHAELPNCPMCGGESWEEAPWSPFSNATQAEVGPAPNL